ncbi:hypothetical protein [Phenylobacterium sp.]|uniref:hypothetical protein n=1 Tax=Phenylobacterium sp. TaxID=1871053 RepID=UPI003BA8D6A8
MTESDDDLFREINRLAHELPADGALHHQILSLGDLENSSAALDLRVATAGASAVEAGLRRAISQHYHADLSRAELDAMFTRGPLASFNGLIAKALALGIVSVDHARELHRLRRVRNAFAHAMNAVTFEDAPVTALMRRLWHYPVTNWAAHFTPVFSSRSQFAIICETFCSSFLRYRVGDVPLTRGGTDS